MQLAHRTDRKAPMLLRPLHHLRRNVIAYLALFIAMGGTGYAATNLPTQSVGAAQLRNYSIGPVKLDPSLINGTVRGWAVVGPAGRVLASGGKPHVTPQVGAGDPGGYGIRWGVRVGRCATQATVDAAASPPTERIPVAGNPSAAFTAGYAVASTVHARRGNETYVQVYNQQGQPTPLGFDVTVIC
jgi:hypothetical protein